MPNCVVCGRGTLMGTKISNGKLCRSCITPFPAVLLPFVSTMSREDIERIERYENELKKTNMRFPISIGCLSIDEGQGIFRIESKGGKEKDIVCFSFLDVDDVGFYCTNPRLVSKHVVCDLEFAFRIARFHLDGHVIVKKNIRCKSYRIDANHLDWREPGDVSLFRNLINQSINTATEKYIARYKHNFITKQAVELFAARSLFMVEESYTQQELKAQRRRLMKAFHPDIEGADARYAKTINDAFDLLSANSGDNA